MEDLELFDKNGNPVLLSEIMSNFLKDNLYINISANKETDYGTDYTTIDVSISLNDTVICSDSATIS